MIRSTTSIPAALVISLALAACSAEQEDKNYEVGVEDVGGGELQVADPQPDDVDVDLPETPMKNVPGEGEESAGDAAGDAGGETENGD
jgi:uncharacterized lipoprotein YehR (DUF1307 family)